MLLGNQYIYHDSIEKVEVFRFPPTAWEIKKERVKKTKETYGENPRDVHTTAVLWLFHISLQTVPQTPLWNISSLPSYIDKPPTSRTTSTKVSEL